MSISSLDQLHIITSLLTNKLFTNSTWILPSKLGVYLTMVPSNQVSQIEVGSGSKAVANNNSNTATYNTLTVFRGSHVCETRPFGKYEPL